MSKRKLTTLLTAIAVSAAAALSVPTATLIAAPASEAGKSSSAKAASNKFYIVRLAESPVTAYKGGIKGYPATKPAKGQKIDPTSSKVANYISYLSGTSRRGARRGGRRPQGVQLWLRLQRLRRRTDRGAGGQDPLDDGRAVGGEGRDRGARHLLDAELPRTRCAGRPLGPARWPGQRRRKHHHRRHRLAESGRRASASPTAPAPTATRPRTASWPTSRSRAGTASAHPASGSTRRSATRS